MLQKLKKFFKKSTPITIADLQVGDIVELSYYHPKELGFFNDNEFTCTRLNPDEIQNRKIKGIVVKTFKNQDLYKWFIEVKTQKIYDNIPVERCFLFLEDEIETLRRIV